MRTILFVCSANQFRSPIAAACFSKKLADMDWGKDWVVQSAGIWASPGSPALPSAIAAANQLGISLTAHKAKLVTHQLIPSQDLVLVMDNQHKEVLQNEYSTFRKHIFLLSEVAQDNIEEIADPVFDNSDNYYESAKKIHSMIENGFYRICGTALNINKFLYS